MASQDDFKKLAAIPPKLRSQRKKSQRELMTDAYNATQTVDKAAGAKSYDPTYADQNKNKS